jgi:hypothetical protein
MMNESMIQYRIGQLQKDIDATWQKYRRLQLELADLLKAQSSVSESETKGQLLTETSPSGHTRYRDQE